MGKRSESASTVSSTQAEADLKAPDFQTCDQVLSY